MFHISIRADEEYVCLDVGLASSPQGEQVDRDFDEPGHDDAALNFAAIIWRSMTHVGFGAGNDGGGYIVSAAFEPGERYLNGVGHAVTPPSVSAILKRNACSMVQSPRFYRHRKATA